MLRDYREERDGGARGDRTPVTGAKELALTSLTRSASTAGETAAVAGACGRSELGSSVACE